MIHVHYGAADRDADAFMYDAIAQSMPSETILLVPDQFTLQAERDAFRYMNADTLFNLEIMSREGFEQRILDREGRPAGTPVGRYGRYMLLASAAAGRSDHDGIFRRAASGSSFLMMLSDTISQLKQFGITPEELADMAGGFAEEKILGAKLRQISEIYAAYQEAAKGLFHDAEDLQDAVAQRISGSDRVRRSVIWVSGFDYLPPGMIAELGEIARTAPELHIVLTGQNESDREEFDMFRRMQTALQDMAEALHLDYIEEAIPETFALEQSPEVRIIRAGDYYAEAETAAILITEMVREKGYRYHDFVILCNDMQRRGSVYSRIFESYGIPLFLDDKRSIAQQPAIEFILAALDCVLHGRRFDDVFRMLRTGFSPLTDEECDRLEMYCRRYHIRSSRWKSDFIYGESEEGTEGLARINQCRRKVDDFLTAAEQALKGTPTVREKTAALYQFLTGYVRIPDRMEEAGAVLEANGRLEAAETAAQVWKTVIELMDQLVEVLGSSEMTMEQYADVFGEGLRAVRIGLIPPSGDQVIMGTVQRTRTGRVKVLMAVGANDGVLPEGISDDDLFSSAEKEQIALRYRAVGPTGRLRKSEQDLALYRHLHHPQDALILMYAAQDTTGHELYPSGLVREYQDRHHIPVPEGDLISSGEELRLIQTPNAAVPHLAKRFRRMLDRGESPDDVWKAASLLMDGTDAGHTLYEGLFFTRRRERIRRSDVKNLFRSDRTGIITLSASAMEKYSRCPFSFFVLYGLHPTENREFEVDLRSIGDIYHDCLRYIADELSRIPGTGERADLSEPTSRWHTVTQDELHTMASRATDEFSSRYREGLFHYSPREEYLRERIRQVVWLNARLMVEQVRSGRVREILFEESFGPNRSDAFPPVQLHLENGDVVQIRGKIDRIDRFTGAETGADYLRIIDYKSGNESFDLEEVRTGWRLQLMLYLKGAMGGIRDTRPAGVFYFAVRDPKTDITAAKESESEAVVRSDMIEGARLDGILVNSPDVIGGMDGTLEPGSKSDVLPINTSKDGTPKGKALLSESSFAELIQQNDENLTASAERLAAGDVSADPKKGKNSDACTWCIYRSICGITQTG